jgi:hypothetical protein
MVEAVSKLDAQTEPDLIAIAAPGRFDRAGRDGLDQTEIAKEFVENKLVTLRDGFRRWRGNGGRAHDAPRCRFRAERSSSSAMLGARGRVAGLRLKRGGKQPGQAIPLSSAETASSRPEPHVVHVAVARLLVES